MSTICLNMIVRNEAPRIIRALASVAPRIHEAAILDTGSTDGTQQVIKEFCEANDIHLHLAEAPFKDFSSARNEALSLAKQATADYILLMDADMELRGDWPPQLSAPSYRILQRHDGGLSYWNTRLIRRDVDAAYVGVTHEYLNLPDGAGPPVGLAGPWFFDHSDGGNRPGKFARDIALLRGALDANPADARSCFYLAQSYRDNGDKELAKLYYARRAQMTDTWEEERWRAKLELARLEDADHVFWQAFNERPTRAEPLHDLALRANQRRQHATAVVAASWGLTIPRPADILFVEDATYEWGLRQEFSIGANYHPDPRVKQLGARVCDQLSVDRSIPEGPRQLAFANYHFYIQPAAAMFPSWKTTPLDGLRVPNGFAPMAPSICLHDGALWSTIRMVNYVAGEKVTWFSPRDGSGVIRTENHLIQLDAGLRPVLQIPILLPEDWPDPVVATVRGVEDLRLVSDGTSLWVSGNTREFAPANDGTPHGWCQMIEAKLDIRGDHARMVDWRIISAMPPTRHEKNWMPFATTEGHIRYLYLCDPTIVQVGGGPRQDRIGDNSSPIYGARFRGSSQLIPWGYWWLGIIHEVEWRESASYYRSRFVEFDEGHHGGLWLRRISRPFYFHHHGLEIAMGLAHGHESNVLVGYSFMEKSPWIGSITTDDINASLGDPI